MSRLSPRAASWLPRVLAALLTLLATFPVPAAGESEPTTWLRQYLQLDTSNPPGNEHRSAGFLASILHSEGISTRLIVSPEGRPNLMARLEGDDSGPGALVLLHHMDVVPPGPDWSFDPFSGRIEQGRLQGRGAIDDKSLGIAHLAAFVDLARSGARLERDVLLLAVADEEAGGPRGTGWLLEHHAAELGEIDMVLGEGGTNRVLGGAVRWWGVEVAQKRPLWLRVTAQGRRGHGSNVDLHSAPHRLVRSLAGIVDRPLEFRLTPAARRYFEALANLESGPIGSVLRRMDEILAGPEPERSLPPGLPNLLMDSVQVNVLAAGERINVTPGYAEALVDVRLLPDTDADAFLADLRRRLGDAVEIEVVLAAPRSAASPTDSRDWNRLDEILEAEAPVVPAFIPGVTDSRYFRELGVPAYGLSPFVLEGVQMRGIHGPDETIPISAFETGVDRMTRIVRALAVRETD